MCVDEYMHIHKHTQIYTRKSHKAATIILGKTRFKTKNTFETNKIFRVWAFRIKAPTSEIILDRFFCYSGFFFLRLWGFFVSSCRLKERSQRRTFSDLQSPYGLIATKSEDIFARYTWSISTLSTTKNLVQWIPQEYSLYQIMYAVQNSFGSIQEWMSLLISLETKSWRLEIVSTISKREFPQSTYFSF